MSNSKTIWVGGALLAALAAGCGSSNQTSAERQTNTYSQLKQQELASERQEFIGDHRKQLDELDNQIARMETRLTHEGQYVDAQQQAEWSQRLFELREQQRRTRAELERAENATPEEWAEMRGAIGNAVDSIEAGVQKLAADMGDLFSSNDATASSQGTIDLCDLRVDGTNAELIEQEQTLVVRLTSHDQRAVENLRARAEQLKEEHGSGNGSATTGNRSSSGTGTYGTSSSSDTASTGQSSNLVEDVSVEDDQNGVRVIFTPAPGQRTVLRDQLSNEVEQIRHQRC